jgi:hypothetical protein
VHDDREHVRAQRCRPRIEHDLLEQRRENVDGVCRSRRQQKVHELVPAHVRDEARG